MVLSVPESVSVFVAVSVLAAVIASVPAAKINFPLPFSSVTRLARLAEVGVATNVSKPEARVIAAQLVRSASRGWYSPAKYAGSTAIESAATSIPVPAPTSNVTLVDELSAPPPVSPAPAISDDVDSALRTSVETVDEVAWVSRASLSRQARMYGSVTAARALPSLTLLVAHSQIVPGLRSLG